MPFIYAFSDSRYERGVKIGRCSSAYAMTAWKAAPSYSPSPMHYLAAWQVDAPLRCVDGSSHARVADLEAHLHRACNPHLVFPRNGREWFDLSGPEAIKRISRILGRDPDRVNGHEGIEILNDNLRYPHPTKLRDYGMKVVVWVYREHLTDRLKTQFVHDWTSPRETRRRYSRNGFSEIMAFTYAGAVSGDGNASIYEAWCQVMIEFGPGSDDRAYGWLNPGAKPEDIRNRYQSLGLIPLDIASSRPPDGVRPAYNRPV
ncbi:hypothetical protein N825_28825 [Skermanella stibiiresistens SB22]|uniref:Bacteriophage T5 Orf172 DNA-binding domain-containing protein n=1 Tax=Skermanella stibiiresistens SB22 TaxID=1385369 RepID=W9GXS5_9PROT|nr:GIY-YIG nuclease family protein [Skermanella stibiiresistens]EWY36278.1 hypothetical protein N825_28825 [Skermanella stibiiresistens SB22]